MRARTHRSIRVSVVPRGTAFCRSAIQVRSGFFGLQQPIGPRRHGDQIFLFGVHHNLGDPGIHPLLRGVLLYPGAQVRIPMKKATSSENKKPLAHSPNPLHHTMTGWLFSVNPITLSFSSLHRQFERLSTWRCSRDHRKSSGSSLWATSIAHHGSPPSVLFDLFEYPLHHLLSAERFLRGGCTQIPSASGKCVVAPLRRTFSRKKP